MEAYQAVQNRTAQTVAVVNQFIPTLIVGAMTAAGLIARSQALGELAQRRDDALAAADAAENAENQAYLMLQALVMRLPKVAENELDDSLPAESDLLDFLSPVYAVTPRSPEAALERARKLASALTHIDEHFAGLTPPRPPVTSAGQGIAELSEMIATQVELGQAVEDRAADVRAARLALNAATSELDRINKRFYSRMKAEAREDLRLAEALDQIVTESDGLPAILGIRSLLQGGADNRQILLNYTRGSYTSDATSSVEWMVAGIDTAFSHSVAADPSGNTIGPFAAGQSVKLRTRVKNNKGSITGSVRTLAIQ